jgi:hypothetical protein
MLKFKRAFKALSLAALILAHVLGFMYENNADYVSVTVSAVTLNINL